MEYKDYELSAEELIKLLKDCACSEYSCMTCPFEDEDEVCDSQLMLNAASKLEDQAYTINGLRKNISKVNSDNDNYMKTIDSLRRQVSRLADDKKGLTFESSKRDITIKNLQENLHNNQTRHHQIIDCLNNRIEDLCGKLVKAEVELAKTEIELGKYIKENANLKKQIEDLEEEQEERCDTCPLIPDGDPNEYDLAEVVNGLVETCDSLVQHRRILPVTLFRYVEDVLHDRARERARQNEDGEDEE